MFLGKQCHSSRGAHSAFKCIVPIAGAETVLSRSKPHWQSCQYIKSHPAWHAWRNGRSEFVQSTEPCPDSGWPVVWPTLFQVDMRMQNPCPAFPRATPNRQKTSLFLPGKRLTPQITGNTASLYVTQQPRKHRFVFAFLPTPAAELGYQSLPRQFKKISPGRQT